MEFLGILCLILITTTLVGVACKRVGVPAVIGQLPVGVVSGPAMLNIVHQDVFVHGSSETGVIMLMFIAGMECELELLKKYAKSSVMVATLGIVLPVGFIMLVGQSSAFSWKGAFFPGLVLVAASASISVEVLRELNILSIVVDMIGASTGGNTEVSFIAKLIEQGLFLIEISFLVHFIAPYLLCLSQRMSIGLSVIIMSLIICLGMVYLADLAGLSSVVGAFFVGTAVGQTDAKAEIDFSIGAIGYVVFIPVFLISTGLSVTFNTLGEDLSFILVMTITAILTKLLGGAWGAKMVGFSSISSLMVGTGMVSRGEMALVIAQIGYQSKLLSEAYYTNMIVVIILTILVAPFLLRYFVRKQESALQ